MRRRERQAHTASSQPGVEVRAKHRRLITYFPPRHARGDTVRPRLLHDDSGPATLWTAGQAVAEPPAAALFPAEWASSHRRSFGDASRRSRRLRLVARPGCVSSEQPYRFRPGWHDRSRLGPVGLRALCGWGGTPGTSPPKRKNLRRIRPAPCHGGGHRMLCDGCRPRSCARRRVRARIRRMVAAAAQTPCEKTLRPLFS